MAGLQYREKRHIGFSSKDYDMSTEPRMIIRDVDPELYKAMGGLGRYVRSGNLDAGLLAIVDIRASQINKCAWCLEMHQVQAREAGITQRQLDLIPAWREARKLYTPRQQAALAFTEAVTLISEDGVPDDVWDDVKANFEEKEIVQLLMAIATINVYNRMNVTMQTQIGDEPFQLRRPA